MDIDEQLRAQSKVLLQRLKARQGKLQNIVNCQSDEETNLKENSTEKTVKSIGIERSGKIKCSSNFRDAELDVSTTIVKRPNSGQPRARQQLARARQNSRKKSDGDKPAKLSNGVLTDSNNFNTQNRKVDVGDKELDIHKESENCVTTPKVIDTDDRLCSQLSNLRSEIGRSRDVDDRDTDAKVRRKIIDKNVKVDSKLNDSELCREDDKSRLNFSYSKFDESDINYLRSKFGSCPEDVDIDKVEEKDTAENNNAVDHNRMLQSAGNDRKVATFIRETMSKPKSILLASGPKDLQKSLSKVSFLSSRDGSMSVPDMDRHLLGYDWIAALLDNDRGAMDHSENYFEELREFRRINRDECVNNFYMGGVDDLLANRDREASPVSEALEETKVKPYTVNNRLFTEPLKQQVFNYSDHDDKESKKTKPPTFEEPRFVRVSIPRSTLLSPHRVKPHRRKSIDDTDSFSLSTHCVKGYENAVPSMVPAASNVGLRDATYGTKSMIQTTLADAEKVAASFPYPWTSSAPDKIRQPHSDHADLYRSYQDMTLPSRLQASTGGTGEESVALKQATEDLLNSTYSLMFEMEKIKKQRDVHSTRQIGNVA